MNGHVLIKRLSGQFLTKNASRILELMFLMLSGMLAIFLHARLRIPLNIPGHHGFEFMLILISVRWLSKLRFAASMSSVGIGLLLLFPVLGFRDPFMGFHYMLPGLALDILFFVIAGGRKFAFLMGVLAGLSYMLIPLSRSLFMLFFDYPYNSFLKHGFVFTYASFFLFAFLGGITGSIILNYLKK